MRMSLSPPGAADARRGLAKFDHWSMPRAWIGQLATVAARMSGRVQPAPLPSDTGATMAEARRSATQAAIRAIIARRAIEMAYQPAVRLDRPGIAFVEALARFPWNRPSAPAGWFAAAREVGLGEKLELLALDSALARLGDFDPAMTLSVNLSPGVLIRSGALKRLAAAPAERLIVEITEHCPVADYDALAEAIRPLRERGLRLAVDDAGAGYANLRHILDLKPDIIKLDMTLTRGIDRDPPRRALAAALTGFAEAIGAELVAEGVESAAELTALRRLGIRIVQGHLYARAAPLGELLLDTLAA